MTPDPVRAAFEAWAIKRHLSEDLDRSKINPEQYTRGDVCWQWAAFQAGRQQMREEAATCAESEDHIFAKSAAAAIRALP